VDGLVLTRSAFHHSMNYRSVVILGEPEEITDAIEKEKRMRIFMEGLMPGRWDGLRPVKPKELKATRLLRLAIDEASAKIRSGPPADDKADYTWPSWGGIIPIETRVGAPQPDEHVKDPGCARLTSERSFALSRSPQPSRIGLRGRAQLPWTDAGCRSMVIPVQSEHANRCHAMASGTFSPKRGRRPRRQ
jgi:hypothetical protein